MAALAESDKAQVVGSDGTEKLSLKTSKTLDDEKDTVQVEGLVVLVYPFRNPVTGVPDTSKFVLKAPKHKIPAEAFQQLISERGVLLAPGTNPATGEAYHSVVVTAPSWAAADKSGLTVQQAKDAKKWTSAGGVVVPSMDDFDHLYVRLPTNAPSYGVWSLPKGRVDPGESILQTAVREVWEETGLHVKVFPSPNYVGVGEGSYNISHYFLMVQVGGHPGPQEETAKVVLATWAEAVELFKTPIGGVTNKRDEAIVLKAQALLAKSHKK
jgi:8-oxo-dGTP pyrophosphatase MutT (NUDIX family)